MFKRVLVPIDIRFLTRMTLETAALFAQEQDAVVTLLYVEDPTRGILGVPFTMITDESIEHFEHDIDEFLKNAASVVSEYGSKAIVQSKYGSPVPAVICDFAAASTSDLIIMGTHGRTGLAHAWWGSVTEEVIRNCDIPVLVVHEQARRRPVVNRVKV